jgi:hypothetical protein
MIKASSLLESFKKMTANAEDDKILEQVKSIYSNKKVKAGSMKKSIRPEIPLD